MKYMCIECVIERGGDSDETDIDSDKPHLWDADPNCDHDVQPASGGGVKCTKCAGWFCY